MHLQQCTCSNALAAMVALVVVLGVHVDLQRSDGVGNFIVVVMAQTGNQHVFETALGWRFYTRVA